MSVPACLSSNTLLTAVICGKCRKESPLSSRLQLPKASELSLWRRLYAGYLPSLTHATLFNAIFFGTFTFFWQLNNKQYMNDFGMLRSLPHQRGARSIDRQPVHYELLGKSILVATCAYTAAQLVCYPVGVYKNMKSFLETKIMNRMLRSFQKPSLSPLYEQATSLRKFFSAANRPKLYVGLWTRIGWSVLSCSMGIAFGSALLTKSYREKNSY